MRTKLINNIMCFIEYELQTTRCMIKVHSKIRPDPIICVLEDVNPYTFNIDLVIPRLALTLVPITENNNSFIPEVNNARNANDNTDEQRLRREEISFDSHLIVSALQSESIGWIDSYEEGLFYKVPKQLISYIEGSKPSKL